MTDLDALYRAICAQPDEDTPRLAYADALEESGDADRAEFVRVQVELAGYEPHVTAGERAARWWDLRRRERVHRDTHPEWRACPCPAIGIGGNLNPNPVAHKQCLVCGGTGDLFIANPRSPGLTYRRVTFARGFINSVECTLAEAFDADGNPSPWAAAVVRAAPVTRLVVTDREPYRDVSIHDENRRTFEWLRWGVGYAPASQVPPLIFDVVLSMSEKPGGEGSDFAEFYSPDAATDALARAAAQLVRRGARTRGEVR